MLTLIQSNQMEVLCAHLSAYLSLPPKQTSLLSCEHILVQSPGMSTWLRLEIAKQNGIAAALTFPLPSSFTWQLCHDLLPNVPQDNAFTKAAMTWKLMQLLPRLLDNDVFEPLRHYLYDNVHAQTHPTQNHEVTDEHASSYTSTPASITPNDSVEHHSSPTLALSDSNLKLYQLCGRIADIFDQYLVYRPDWILAWENNESPLALNKEQLWQPLLWRALIEFNREELQQSQYHRANLHQALITALTDPNTDITPLPQRLFVFGISSMAPQTLEVLYHLAGRIDVVVLSLSPCQHYWGDIVDPKRRARIALQYADKRQLAEQWEEKLEVGNPLLANNGKMGRELLDMLLSLPPEHTDFGHDLYYPPCDDPNAAQASLLQGVQYDILEMQTLNHVLGPDKDVYQQLSHRRCLKKEDHSLCINSCHSPLRELETLHDHLLRLLSDDTSLQPKDIVVMMPDVAAYAPYIDAVFAAKQGLAYLPYAIADRGAAQESPLINSFLHLLNINQSRFGLTEIVSILEVPAILCRFQLNDDELQLIRRWLDEAGVRWGRDQQTRQKQGIPAFEQHSWAQGIKRLILGYAFSDNAPLYHNELIVTGIEGQAAQALGKLLNFIEALDETQAALSQAQSGRQQLQVLTQLLDTFYTVDESERAPLQSIRDAIASLETELIAANIMDNEAASHSELILNIEVLQHWFNQRLTESRVGQRYLAGSINFCTLMPMRSIPFKIVCLLGMNDGVYPRVQHPIGFDLMAHFGARQGDRSRRLDDRYLFLEALLSAREQLYISYIGRSERDNSERMPSMLVSELIEYCQLCYLPEAIYAERLQLCHEQAAQCLQETLICHQPLQPFDPRLYQAESLASANPIKQSYNAQWCPPNATENSSPHDVPHDERFITANLRLAEHNTTPHIAAPDHEPLEVSALMRFFHHPAKYFFNRRLKVDLSLNIQADDNDEPFSLNALERYKLQSSMLHDTLSQQLTTPDPDLLQRFKAAGRLPMAPFDDLLLTQYQHDLQPLISRALFLKGEVASQYQDIALTFSPTELNIASTCPAPGVALMGRIDDVSAKGLVNCRPGRAHGRDLLGLYLRHLCLLAMGQSNHSYLLDINQFHALAPIPCQQAKYLLSDLVQLYRQGQRTPLCFMPRTSYAYAKTEGDHDTRLAAAQPEWLDEQTQLGDGMEPHYQRVFCFPDDFNQTGFGQLAERIFNPMISLYHCGPLAGLEPFVNEAHHPATPTRAMT